MAVSYRDELVAVFATTPVANIKDSADYQKLLKLYGDDSWFQAERDVVEKAKVHVETFLCPPKTQAEEVQAALELLVAARRDPKLDLKLLRKLLDTGYKPDWTAAQQAYFDSAWNKITARHDFFLSFTTRYEDVPGENTINTAYEYFIKSVLKSEEIKGADKKKTNLLAHAVVRLLTKPPKSPFFFPHVQYDNTNTRHKLTEACNDTLVLVQLVRNIMFVPPAGGRQNWCHYEYETVFNGIGTTDERSHRILFIVAENEQALIDKLFVPPSYRAWHGYIAERDPPYLPEVDTYDAKRIEAAKRLLTEKIRPLLDRPLRLLVEGVPA